MKQNYLNYPLTGLPSKEIESFDGKIFRSSFLFLLLLLLAFSSSAQLVVTQNSNTQALVQLLAGNGVTISNWTKTCANNATGTFNNVSSNLGVPGGIVLATGNASSIPNSANNFASTQFTGTGDAELSTLTNGTIYDKCVIEFDIVPQGPILQFDYVFASEEYPEWVCSQFNDVFGFFISGPNPGGGNFVNKNIAKIPNTNLPVAINTVNGGGPGANAGGGTCNGANQSLAYSSYFRDNLSPVNPSIIYDGMTTVLSAITPVTPCQTYHLKIAIADVADRIYDSGVFLQAYSFTSNPISVSATSALAYAGFSSAYEGCVGGTFTLTLNQPQQTDVYANVVVSGTATNGVDYTNIPATVLFPAGTTSVNINLNPIADGITEPAENVTIAVLDPCTGVVSSSASITIRDDIPPTITVADSTLCLGQSTQLIATGGVNYTWSPAAGLSSSTVQNPIATPTVTTTYTVSMQWGSCVKTASATVYVSNPNLTINASPAGVVCNGGNVALTAAPSNGVSPYSYLWSNSSTSSAINVSTGGSYNVTATDSYGCSASATRSVTISNLSLSGVYTNVSCIGGNNGAIDITVTGANAPFTYNWGGGVSSQDRTNLAAGTYNVTASNTVGCSVTATYTITQPAANLTTSATNTPVNCFGGNNGSINLTVNGGVSPYTYAWSNSATTEDLNNIQAGSYSVTVTDFNGCTALRSVTVSQPTAITTSYTQVNPLCNGVNTGSINLNAAGGVGTFSYAWSNGASTQNLSGILAGSYTVTVADGNGCTASRTVNITQPAALAVTNIVSNPSCFGSANGSINLTVSGGTGVYSYNWGGGITTQNRTGLAAGTYSVTVTDASGCSASVSTTLTQPSAALSVSVSSTNVSCNGANNGTINLTVSGGTSAYTYNWGGGVTSQNRTGLSAGSYTVTITDAQACTATASASILQPTTLSVTNVKTNVSCNGGNNGTINITASGGSINYSYNWGGGVTVEDRTNLVAGTYTVTVTDANGCTATSSATITQPSILAFSQTHTNVTCNGGNNGSINITVSGGSSPYSYNWGGGVTSQNRTLLGAGTYTVTATDNAGCSISGSVNITQPALLSITEIVSNASCAVGNDGTINLTVTGGAAPYSYNWGGGITTQNRTGLTAGTYTVTVTDNVGCTSSKSVAVSQIGTGISLTASVTNVACNGGNNGAIDVTVIGGTSPISYNWGGGIATEDRTGLSASSYSVTVTDGLGCSAVSSNNITQPLPISISSTVTNVLCFGAGTGMVDVTATGGTGVLSYDWGSGITTEDRTSVNAGTYTVTVTDANSCTASSSSVVSQPIAAINLTTSVTPVACFGWSSGNVNLTASGGSGGYSYSWSNSSISEDLVNVVSNTYTVTVTDANSCTATTVAIVNQPSANLSVNLAATPLTCNGVNTGAITTTVTGGTSAYTYNWGGGVTTQNRSSLPAGIYTVTVTDAQSCTTTASASIAQPASISISSTKTNISCNGGSNGSINLTVSGGTGSYTYNWGGGITTQNRTGLIAGSYAVTVTDANGCTATHSVTITQPSALTLTLNSGTSVCLNPTGTATAVMNNSGSAPYNFAWSNGATSSQNVNGLPPGSISVTVTDANACSVSGSVVVGLSGNNTNANFSNSSPLCGPNAAVNFTHTGSSNIVSHVWEFGDATGTSATNNPLHTYVNPGTYNVTHIVVRGFCEDTVVRTITVNAKPVISSMNNNLTCNGSNNGSINLSVTGASPFSYNWGGGITTQNRTFLSPGNYTVTVTDANACTSSLTSTITQPNILAVSSSVTNLTCNGGTNGAINITATGGTTPYAYDWGGGNTIEDRTNLSAGIHSVTVTDANFCNVSAAISVAQPNAISISGAVSPSTCNNSNNGSIVLSVSGGTGAYSYNWGGGVTVANRTNLNSGSYSVTVMDNNLCSASASFVVSQPNILSTTLIPTAALCYGGNNGSIISNTIGGTGPYFYTWNDGNTNGNRSSLSAGTYSVTILDNNSCSTSASTVISQPNTAVSIVVNSANVLSCYGDSNGVINVTTSGGIPTYSFNWSDGATSEDRANILGGTYFVTATDQNGCYATATATVNQPISPLSIDTIMVTDVLCFNGATGAISLSVSGGTLPHSYNWGGGVVTANRTNLSAGTYTVTVSDNNGCSVVNSVVVTQPAVAVSATTAVTNVTCFGGNNGTIDLSVSNGTSPYSYLWTGGAVSEDLSALVSGNYSVMVTDANSCTASASASVTQPTALVVTSLTSTNVSCFGGTNGAITLSISGATAPYSFNWGGGVITQNRTGLAAGTYTVTVTDALSCTASNATTITQPVSSLVATVTSVTNVSCFGGANGSINVSAIGGTAPYAYNWGGGITTQNRVGLSAGTYNLTVTDANACTTITSAAITQPAASLNVVVSATTNVSCFGGSNGTITIAAAGGTAPYAYNWGSGITTQNRTGLSSGTYVVTITDAQSCSASISAIVSQPSAALSLSVSNTPVSCFGGNNGTINILPSGGTAPYSFNWNGGATTQNRTGLSSGNYSVTVTDAQSCTASSSSNVTQPSLLSATSTHADVMCNGGADGSINLTLNGGTSGYSFLWSNGSTTEDITSLASGNYTVTASDANNCTVAHTVAVAQPAPLQATTITANVSCNGGTNGSIQLTVTGGVIPYSFNWSSGINAQTVSNIQAGTYSVTVHDSHNCTTTISVNIVEPTPIVLSTAITNVNCNNGNTGAIDLTVNGGVSGYSYNWGGGITTQDRVNLTAGTYTVTVTDANSCSAVANAAVSQPTAVTGSAAVTNVLCYGNSTGAINLTPTGGVSPYTYNWGGGVIVEDRTNIPSGNYTVTITDANSCTASVYSTVTQPAAALNTTVVNITNVSCFGGNTGAVTMAVSGGTSPYSYVWNDGAVTLNRTALAAGTYTLTVTDAASCSAAGSATIIQPTTPLAIAVSSLTNVACYNGNNGSINVTASGGTPSYTYNWGGGIVTQNRINLSAGNYSVTVTDAQNCTASVSSAITQPTSALTVALSSTTNVLCFGGTNGALNITASGGTTPYNYLWNDAVTTEDRSNLSAGAYSVTITDANNCSVSSSNSVSQPSALSVALVSSTPVACFGGSNGAINISAIGGVTNYTYNWGGGVITQNRTGLSSGSYNVTVTDANACSVSLSATVTQPAAPLSVVVANATNVSCYNGSNGAITIATTGGTTGYSYNWGGGVTTQNRTGLAAGSYAVTVTDANLCSASLSSTITQPTLLAVATSSTNVLCYGASTGAVVATPAGGTSGYSYTWSNGSTSGSITNVASGSYQVTITDANSCSASAAAIVTQPSAIAVTETHYNAMCNGAATGIIDITATGGVGSFGYLWSNGSTDEDQSGLLAAVYTVTVTDANACSVISNVQITQPSPFSISFTSTNVTCNGGNDGNINLTVSGATPGYVFQWNNGVATEDLNNITAGSYNVIIHDQNNCVASANVTITQPGSLVVVTNTHTNVSCNSGNDGAIDITIQGGTFPFSYSWNDGANTQDRTGLVAGTYQITVNDLNSCAISQPIVITEPTPISVTLSKTDVTCNGLSNATILSTVSGGTPAYGFAWSNGSTAVSLQNVPANNYTLSVMDSKNCVVTVSTTVNQPAPLLVSGVKIDVNCYGLNTGSVDLTASGGNPGYQYLWNTSSTIEDALALSAGNYSVSVTDANNCSVSAAFVINQPAQLSVILLPTHPQCNGSLTGSIDLTVNGGTGSMNYLWSNGGVAEDPVGLGAGNFTVTVTDANGCVISGSTTIIMPLGMSITEAHTAPTCNGGINGSIAINVSGGTPAFSYIWSNGASSSMINNVAAGNYSVSVTDANGCQAALNSIVISDPSMIGVGVAVSDVLCAGGNDGAVNITVSGGTPAYQYTWSTGAVTEDLNNVVTGSYSVTITDAHGCVQSASGFVNTLPSMQVSAVVDQLVCVQDVGGIDVSVQSGSTPYSFYWSNGDNSEDLNGIHSGSYSLVIIDNNGCVFDTSFNVVNLNQFSVDATGSTTITLGETANLNAIATGSNQTTYNWTPTYGLACVNCSNITVQPGQTTLYTVVATDTNGCVAQDTVTVAVIADHTVFTPNAFTPNGDGNNDVFQLFGNKAGIKYLNIMIFDRWGEKVFEGNSADFAWDGTYKGQLVEPDVYVYVMKIVHLDGKNSKVFKGSLTILR